MDPLRQPKMGVGKRPDKNGASFWFQIIHLPASNYTQTHYTSHTATTTTTSHATSAATFITTFATSVRNKQSFPLADEAKFCILIGQNLQLTVNEFS